MVDFKPGDYVSFSTYYPIRGISNFVGKVRATLSSEYLAPTSTAPTDHVNVYRTLPESIKLLTKDDWESYDYAAIALPDGNVVHIGIPWIVEASLSLNSTRFLDVHIGPFSDADELAVINLLTLAGYPVLSSKIGVE